MKAKFKLYKLNLAFLFFIEKWKGIKDMKKLLIIIVFLTILPLGKIIDNLNDVNILEYEKIEIYSGGCSFCED